MILNKHLEKLLEILEIDPEKIFNDGIGIYKQNLAENFIENLLTEQYALAEGELASEYEKEKEDEIESAKEEATEDVKDDIERYVKNNLLEDYKDCIASENIDTTSEDFTIEEQFEIIKDLILENL